MMEATITAETVGLGLGANSGAEETSTVTGPVEEETGGVVKLSKLDGAFEKASMQQSAVVHSETARYLVFRPYIDPISIRPYKPADKGYYFKFYNNVGVTLVRYSFEDNGFREAAPTDRNCEWSVIWACSNLKSALYQSMTRFQKVNHFPKSTEITRKDNMYQHLASMSETHGEQHFKFLPYTFILPAEHSRLKENMEKNPSKKWIIKPASSSQGKGIFLT